MSFWDDIDVNKQNFTSAELKVAQCLREEPFAFSSGTASEVANKFNISQSSISRFCRKMGYSGFSDFRLSLMLAMAVDDSNRYMTLDDYALTLCDVIKRLSQSLDDKELNELAQRILKAHATYTSGYGASQFPAYLLAFRAVLSSVTVHNISASEEMEKLHIINHDDIIILFSATNPSHKDFISIYKDLPSNKKPYLVLVTSSNSHPFIKYANQVFVLPYLHDVNSSYSVPTLTQIFFVLFLLQKIYSIKSIQEDNN